MRLDSVVEVYVIPVELIQRFIPRCNIIYMNISECISNLRASTLQYDLYIFIIRYMY